MLLWWEARESSISKVFFFFFLGGGGKSEGRDSKSPRCMCSNIVFWNAMVEWKILHDKGIIWLCEQDIPPTQPSQNKVTQTIKLRIWGHHHTQSLNDSWEGVRGGGEYKWEIIQIKNSLKSLPNDQLENVAQPITMHPSWIFSKLFPFSNNTDIQ